MSKKGFNVKNLVNEMNKIDNESRCYLFKAVQVLSNLGFLEEKEYDRFYEKIKDLDMEVQWNYAALKEEVYLTVNNYKTSIYNEFKSQARGILGFAYNMNIINEEEYSSMYSELETSEVEESKVAEVEESKVAEVEESKVAEVEESKVAEVEESEVAEVEESKVAEVEESKVAEVEESEVAEVEDLINNFRNNEVLEGTFNYVDSIQNLVIGTIKRYNSKMQVKYRGYNLVIKVNYDTKNVFHNEVYLYDLENLILTDKENSLVEIWINFKSGERALIVHGNINTIRNEIIKSSKSN